MTGPSPGVNTVDGSPRWTPSLSHWFVVAVNYQLLITRKPETAIDIQLQVHTVKTAFKS